jgi:hypothetical protein
VSGLMSSSVHAISAHMRIEELMIMQMKTSGNELVGPGQIDRERSAEIVAERQKP